VASVASGDSWQEIAVDLGAFAGRSIYVRFVFDQIAPAFGRAPDAWTIDRVAIAIGR
jgi:hypothetical protein